MRRGARNPLKRLVSEAEFVVMDVIWQHAPVSSDVVVTKLAYKKEWREATVKSMLNRLLRKGALSVEREGNRYLYSATLRKDDWIAVETKNFLDRFYDGRVAPLISHFSMHRKLSRRDLMDLRRLVQELGEDDELFDTAPEQVGGKAC